MAWIAGNEFRTKLWPEQMPGAQGEDSHRAI